MAKYEKIDILLVVALLIPVVIFMYFERYESIFIYIIAWFCCVFLLKKGMKRLNIKMGDLAVEIERFEEVRKEAEVTLQLLRFLMKPMILFSLNQMENNPVHEGAINFIAVDENAQEIFNCIPHLKYSENETNKLKEIEQDFWQNRKKTYEELMNYYFDENHKMTESDFQNLSLEQIENLDFRVAVANEAPNEMKLLLTQYQIIIQKIR